MYIGLWEIQWQVYEVHNNCAYMHSIPCRIMQTHAVFQLTVVRKGLFKGLHRVRDGSFLLREAGDRDVVSLLPDVE